MCGHNVEFGYGLHPLSDTCMVYINCPSSEDLPAECSTIAVCQGACVVTNSVAECKCANGYELATDGVTCTGKR